MENTTGTNLNGPQAVRGKSDNAPATEKLAQKAHETIDKFADSTADAEQRVRASASDAAGKLRDTEVKAREAADRSVEKVADYVQHNPLMSAGIAFVAGALLSSLLRR